MRIIVNQGQQKVLEANILNEDILNGGEIYIGREADCHIQLNSQKISRHHAVITLVENDIVLKVLSNYGGVKVNGNEGDLLKLSENDRVEVDNYELLLSELPELTLHENLIDEPTTFMSEDEVLGDQADNQQSDENNEDGQSEEIDSELNLDDPQEQENLDPQGGESTEDSPDEIDHDDVLTDEGEVQDQQEGDFSANEFNSNDDFEQGEFGENQFEESGFGENNDFGEDENFANDAFSASSDEDSTQLIQTFATYTLQLFGEFAPFDRYVIDQSETFIGRDPEKCQIVLDDPEVSKVHAVIKKSQVSCILEDLDSSNGIICNGERVNKKTLTNDDEFLIGDTTFTVTISSDIIEAEKDVLMPVDDNQEVEIEEIVEEEVDFDQFGGGEDFQTGGAEKEKSLFKRIWKDPKKRKYLIIGLAVFALLLLLEDDSTTVAPNEEVVVKSNQKKKTTKKKKFSAETLEKLESNYSLALANFEQGELYQAKDYLDIVMSVDPTYKDAESLSKLIGEGLEEQARLKAKEQEEKERRERQVKINALLEKAREAVKNREVGVARNYFNMIFELDPENIDVPPLKLEIDAYEEEQKRKEQEEMLKKQKRQAMVNKLKPGKSLYLKEEWFKAINKLESFLKLKNMDEDLVKEASAMLKDSRLKLKNMLKPMLSKARSYKEGQDLKQAYETYGEVLKVDPSNEEALNQRNLIFTTLRNRSRKVYREALVAESLSLFNKAKEKFQEVQQISPINSEYYIKATQKLKNYLE
ncbi:MAG: FHA domain-containing protein [Bacteriovoracaceae bacterium]|jgi:pSer/pThr/pTyr-binding forkhead associated (FHA) protein|nr:hypothetical protein [Halobacteriovoraceae bacterium]MDP7321699.1 FHA domain-containing protein [Bacteriovoracaceae bacterium]